MPILPIFRIFKSLTLDTLDYLKSRIVSHLHRFEPSEH